MKQIAVITPVPDVINTLIENSMLRKSIENEAVKFHVVNLRDYGKGSYRQVDDAPFGGGGGMVMMAEPLSKAIDDTISIIGCLLYTSPSPRDQRGWRMAWCA